MSDEQAPLLSLKAALPGVCVLRISFSFAAIFPGMGVFVAEFSNQWCAPVFVATGYAVGVVQLRIFSID